MRKKFSLYVFSFWIIFTGAVSFENVIKNPIWMERIQIESNQGNPEREELPLEIPPFYIDRTEVTQNKYLRVCKIPYLKRPKNWSKISIGSKHKSFLKKPENAGWLSANGSRRSRQEP